MPHFFRRSESLASQMTPAANGAPAADAPRDAESAAPAYPENNLLSALAPDGIQVHKRFALNSRPFWIAVVTCALGALALMMLDAHDEAVGEEVKTITSINKFELNSMGEIKTRLASRTDSTLYEFLATHHDTALLQGAASNVIKEVLLAIEHDSVQTGVPLVVGLFADVFKVWPVAVLPREDRAKLESQQSKISAYLAKRRSSGASTPTYDDEGNALVEETRLMLIAIRDSGAQVDNLQLGHILAESDLNRAAAFLSNLLMCDATRPFLERLSAINDREFAKPSQFKKVPSEKTLQLCTKALKELEDFLADKPEASALLRNLLLADLKKSPPGRRR